PTTSPKSILRRSKHTRGYIPRDSATRPTRSRLTAESASRSSTARSKSALTTGRCLAVQANAPYSADCPKLHCPSHHRGVDGFLPTPSNVLGPWPPPPACPTKTASPHQCARPPFLTPFRHI